MSFHVTFGVIQTPWSDALVAVCEQKICFFACITSELDGVRAQKDLLALFPDAVRVQDIKCGDVERALFVAYRLEDFHIPWGTAFQRRVWQELLTIPYGATVTYSDVARRIGNSKAVRAVARAIGSNPISVFIPCHRVIGASGALTGYRWGLKVKQALLEAEALNAPRGSVTGRVRV